MEYYQCSFVFGYSMSWLLEYFCIVKFVSGDSEFLSPASNPNLCINFCNPLLFALVEASKPNATHYFIW